MTPIYKRKQAEIFQQQLEVAVELGLNCIIHQRSSFDDILAQIQPFAQRTQGVFHCFGESVGAVATDFGPRLAGQFYRHRDV